jgi:anionic cell wall polymer biosynthesis LytR-Cps2A-Psr (LCP) family protein
MPLQVLLKQATGAIGINMENVTMQMLPGEDRYQSGVSFYFHDPEAVKELLTKIYTEDEAN